MVAKVLIVEDQAVVAKDIEDRLGKLGYGVSAIATSGEQAVEEAGRDRPNLVLMDIRLQGKMGGIRAAGDIRDQFDIPVVYLTAYADEQTLRRAKVTQPYGYVLKPFQTKELQAAIEMALMRHRLERDLRREKAELQKAEEKYRFLYERSPALHLVVGADGSIQDVNATVARTLDYARDELLGRHVLEFIDPQDSGKVLEELARGPEVSLTSDVEVVVHARDGTRRTFLFSQSMPIRGPGQDATGSLLTGIDITDRKIAEGMLQQREERLQHARKMRMVGRLAAGVARRFNDLLTVILGNAQLLKSQRRDDAGLVRMLDPILQASRQGADLTAKLRGLAPERELKMEPVDVHDVIAEAVAELADCLGSTVQVRRSLRAEPSRLLADRELLRGALVELGRNARDAMPGGGTLSFSTGIIDLDDLFCCTECCQLVPGRYLQVSVADSGMGMDEPTRRQAFEPFFSTKDESAGAGLGLALVYGCVEAHAGAVQIVATEGTGTEVILYFPPTPSPEPAG